MRFKSNSDEVRYWARILLQDREERSVQQIKDYVAEKSGKTFTNGTYAGALRDLVANANNYSIVSRGIYKFDGKVANNETDQLAMVKSILQNAINSIREECGKLNPLDLSAKEFENLHKVKQIILSIEKIESSI